MPRCSTQPLNNPRRQTTRCADARQFILTCRGGRSSRDHTASRHSRWLSPLVRREGVSDGLRWRCRP
jgi:hypothetical protein